MSEAQIEKLKKLLALTTSENDHEALAAVRQANKILKDTNKTWSDVVGADLTEANSRFNQLHLKYVALINEYNKLHEMVATQQAVTALGIPQRSTPQRRTRRF